jgi:hypothetical protein
MAVLKKSKAGFLIPLRGEEAFTDKIAGLVWREDSPIAANVYVASPNACNDPGSRLP